MDQRQMTRSSFLIFALLFSVVFSLPIFDMPCYEVGTTDIMFCDCPSNFQYHHYIYEDDDLNIFECFENATKLCICRFEEKDYNDETNFDFWLDGIYYIS